MSNDLQLRHDVIEELSYEPSINSAHIGVAVDGGVVTLTGHAANYPEKVNAVEAVRRVHGVLGIADEIQVRYPSEKVIADDQLAKHAVSVLDWDDLVPKNSVKVLVRNGWVTLSGVVNWFYQKKSAEDDVRKLPGVLGVFNKIEIEQPTQARDIKKSIEQALKRHAEIEAGSIRVTVNEGNSVLLEGTVDSWQEHRAVQAAAWSAAGVGSVEDRLQLASSSSAT